MVEMKSGIRKMKVQIYEVLNVVVSGNGKWKWNDCYEVIRMVTKWKWKVGNRRTVQKRLNY